MPHFEGPPLAHQEAHQAEQEHQILPSFELPDLSPLAPEKDIRTEVIDTTLEIGETCFLCRLTFERYKEPNTKQAPTEPFQKAQMHSEVLDPNTQERAAVFKGALQFGNEGSNPVAHDKKNRAFWRIYTRRVEKDARHKGMGSATLRAFEELAERIGDTYPDLQAEWITVSTHLSSLTKMIIRQDWLAEHHLEAFQKRSGPDFGYIPHADDASNVQRVLEADHEELQDISGSSIPEIRLFKAL